MYLQSITAQDRPELAPSATAASSSPRSPGRRQDEDDLCGDSGDAHPIEGVEFTFTCEASYKVRILLQHGPKRTGMVEWLN